MPLPVASSSRFRSGWGLSTPPLAIHKLGADRLSACRPWDRLTVVISAWAVVVGAVAGAGGAAMLRKIPRGVRVPVPVCAALVAVLWGVASGRAEAIGLPLWWWPVPLIVSWAGVLLGGTDLVARRLPDALTLPLYPLVAILLGAATIGAADPGLLPRSAAGALLWAGGYGAVRLAAPGALGGGDVKLAGSLGALTAATSWSGLLLAILAASAVTAVAAAPARILGHAAVPHGPAMLAAAWLVVLHPPL